MPYHAKKYIAKKGVKKGLVTEHRLPPFRMRPRDRGYASVISFYAFGNAGAAAQ